MSHTITLRGQKVRTDGRRLYIEIYKPVGQSFSISDKIKGHLDKGGEVVVKVAGRLILLTRTTPFLWQERVKSKFPNSPDWYRFWYKIPSLEEEQKELF